MLGIYTYWKKNGNFIRAFSIYLIRFYQRLQTRFILIVCCCCCFCVCEWERKDWCVVSSVSKNCSKHMLNYFQPSLVIFKSRSYVIILKLKKTLMYFVFNKSCIIDKLLPHAYSQNGLLQNWKRRFYRTKNVWSQDCKVYEMLALLLIIHMNYSSFMTNVTSRTETIGGATCPYWMIRHRWCDSVCQ